MQKLSREDLYGLERYSEIRSQFRTQVMAHKQPRRVRIGEHATLYFEDRLTMQYQVQEMLRAERIFEAAGIQDELDIYNPLIPDGSNWKATFMVEYADAEERQRELARLIGIEDTVWVKVAGHDPVHAIADEDLERETEDKTSSVHFLRFELPAEQVRVLKDGAALSMGIDHQNHRLSVDPVSEATRAALAPDLD